MPAVMDYTFCTSNASAPTELTLEDLAWAEAMLRRSLGPDAEEYAGVGLMKAMETFDASHGMPWRAWARKQIIWEARDEMRRFCGRPGSRLHEARRTMVEVNDADQDIESSEVSVDEAVAREGDQRRRVVDLLQAVDRLEGITRLVAIGKLLSGLDETTIAELLHVSRATVHHQLSLVRKSLSVAGRDDVLRRDA